MLGHTKKRLIDSEHVHSNLNKLEKFFFIPWRETSKERIEKYTEPAIMLRGSRYKAELTQKQLAELLAISQHHISEMENGKRSIGKTMVSVHGVHKKNNCILIFNML